MPALFTSTSSPPNVSIACLTSLSAPAQDGDVVAVDDRVAAGVLDQLHGLLGWGRVAALAAPVAAEVVDHDPGALGGEGQRLFASDAAAGSGDDGDFAVQRAHVCSCS